MSTTNNTRSAEQDKTPQDDRNRRPVVIQSDDTVESFIRRHAGEIAEGEGLKEPAREAFIKRMVSLGIYRNESPSSDFSLVYHGDEALKRMKERYLVGDKQGWAQIENYNVAEAMDLVRLAKKDPDAFVKQTGEFIRHAQADALLHPGRTAESDVYAFGNSLRQGGFHKIAIDNANEMFEAYQKMYANLGRNPEFHKYADTLAEKLKTAAEHGVVSERTRDGILKEVEGLKEKYRIWTPEETAAYDQKRTQGMKPYQDLLTEMEYLRDSFAKRGNVSLGAGALTYHMTMDTIRKVDAFAKIVQEGTPEDAAKFVRENGLQKYFDNPGSLQKKADDLTALDASHNRFFKNAHAFMEATGIVPAVVAAKIMQNIMDGQRKGLGEAEITKNFTVDIASELGLKKLKLTGAGETMAGKAMGEFIRNVTTEFAKDPSVEGMSKGLGNSFYKVLTSTILKDALKLKDAMKPEDVQKAQEALKKLSPEQLTKLREFVVDLFSKMGANEQVKPFLEKVFPSPAKEQSTNLSTDPISTPAKIETKNYASLVDSARKLDLQPGVTAENVALMASEVARRENVNATIVVQGSRNPDALAAVDPALNIGTSAFTQTEVRQMDVAKTLAALDQRQAALQPDPEAQAQRAGRQV